MRPPKIAVLGVFGAGNFGNEATLAAYLQILRSRHPDADVTCICYNTELVEQTYGVHTLPISGGRKNCDSVHQVSRRSKLKRRLLQTGPAKVLRTILAIAGSDALIIPGTGILDDYGTTPGGLPWHLFRWCAAARIMGVPVSFIAIGAGPIHNARSRRLMGWAAKLARHRSYRDQNSREFTETLGVNTRQDPLLPDLVFQFAETKPKHQPAPTRGLRVGLGVMAYYGWTGQPDAGTGILETYLAKIKRFTTWLLDQGHHVHFLLGELSDKQAMEQLLQPLRDTLPAGQLDRMTANEQSSMSELLNDIEPLDIVITSRYHNIIGAFCRGIPAISIGYSPKCYAVMDDFGLGEFCQDIESLDVDRLIAQFEKLQSRLGELRESILTRALGHRNTLSKLVEPAGAS